MVVNWFSTLDQHAMDYNDTLMFGWWSKPTATSTARVDDLLIFCWCWLFIDVWIFDRYETTSTSLEYMKGLSCVDVDFSLTLGICDRYSTTTSPELINGWSLVDVD